MKFKLVTLMLTLCVLCACKTDTKDTDETKSTSPKVLNETIKPNVEIAYNLLKRGVTLNDAYLKNSLSGGVNNNLILQFAFENDFSDIIYVKVVDKNNGKARRAKLEVNGSRGRVDVFSFSFADTVQIDAKSLILVE